MRKYYSLCILVCGILIEHINVNIAEAVKPPIQINRLLTIQSKLQKLQDDLASSIIALHRGGNKDSITIESSAIEGDFQFLKKEIASIIENPENSQEPATEPLKSLGSNPREDQLTSDIIADIRKSHFASAEEKLKQLDNLEELSKIIRAVYENDSNNFDLLARFIESLSDIKFIYACVSDLLNEMVDSNHTNPFKCIRLAKVLQTVFINPPEVDYFTIEFGKNTYNTLKDKIKYFTLEALNEGEFDDGNGAMDNLTTAVYLNDPDQWETIIYEFVNTNMDSIPEVLDIIDSHRLIEQRVSGVSILYWSIMFNDQPKSDVTIRIASILKDLRSDEKYPALKTSLKDLVNEIINNLPTCARNLFFLPSACIWNKGANSYLTALNSSFKHEPKRREVFSTDVLPGSHWFFHNIDNYFVISSRTYGKELLFAAKTKHNPNLRHVFNWASKSRKKIEERTKWVIEIDNDYCYLKSAKYNEYLITSNFDVGNNFKYVFTWVPKTFLGEPQFQWQIRDCN